MKPTLLSFVVPAHNEEQLLGATLESIHRAAQDCAIGYEVIVVNDGSTDRTALIAEKSNARLISVHHRQIAATRNSGSRVAKGDVLLFVDADTQINNVVLRSAIDAITGGAIGGGAAVRFDGCVPRYARVLLPLMIATMRVLRLAAGCFVFCTRPAFEAAGGFDERLFGAEEIALSVALKRIGRFVILRDSVLTSGRKLRTYSGFEILRIIGRFAVRGRKMIEQREQMGQWYDPRRTDPAPAPSKRSSNATVGR
ncbi:MAG: glycosyltransferase [Burkholderiaceae bacterium]